MPVVLCWRLRRCPDAGVGQGLILAVEDCSVGVPRFFSNFRLEKLSANLFSAEAIQIV